MPQRGILRIVPDASEITVLQLPKFKAEATELIGADEEITMGGKGQGETAAHGSFICML